MNLNKRKAISKFSPDDYEQLKD